MSNPLLPTDIFDELAAIRRRLDTLERSTGYQQTINLSDATGTQRVLIGRLLSGDYGIQVNDAAGVARFLTNANGIQVNDAGGTMIMDSVGLSQVMKNILHVSDANVRALFDTSGVYASWPGTQQTFTVPGTRSVPILCLAAASISVMPETNGNGYVCIRVIGVATSFYILLDVQHAHTPMTHFLYIPSIAPGTYTLEYWAQANVGVNPWDLNLAGYGYDVYQLGG